MFFSTCLGLCIWKVADSFVTFGAKEVGTKIDIKYNHETDLPGFAICRHPNQILGKIDRQNSSLESAYRLKISDIRYLKAFQNVENANANILDIYKNFAFNDSASVSSIVLSSRGQYVGTATPSLVTMPQTDEKQWSSFWHPLYGVCFAFQLEKSLAEVVGEAGLEFVKVNLNFEKAFPMPDVEPAEPIIVIRQKRQNVDDTTPYNASSSSSDENLTVIVESGKNIFCWEWLNTQAVEANIRSSARNDNPWT